MITARSGRRELSDPRLCGGRIFGGDVAIWRRRRSGGPRGHSVRMTSDVLIEVEGKLENLGNDQLGRVSEYTRSL